jgi:cytochrome P450
MSGTSYDPESEPSVAPSVSASKGTRTGFRSYEVYQRMRVRETTPLIKPRQLSSSADLTDPFSLVAILRENYPCYRDWPGNAFWITRYDDVTSVFVDDANYETRSRRWRLGLDDSGTTDFSAHVAVRSELTEVADAQGEQIARGLVGEMVAGGAGDLAVDVCALFPIRLLRVSLGLPGDEEEAFARLYLTMHRGVSAGADPPAREAAVAAMSALAGLLSPHMNHGPGLLAVIGELGGTVDDVVATLLELDHETLHGSLANLWSLLLTHPEHLDAVRAEPRLLKFAWAETIRHSPPVLSADRFARHEVERFGRLIPEGALLRCCAAAANRDPRIFADPDAFDPTRKDLCQREPRGTYRADGLASGVSFATGAPSKHPALPEDRPRSAYALTRDLAVMVSRVILDELPDISLAPDAVVMRRSLRLGELHTCWALPVTWRAMPSRI